jgi:hypothetical protein
MRTILNLMFVVVALMGIAVAGEINQADKKSIDDGLKDITLEQTYKIDRFVFRTNVLVGRDGVNEYLVSKVKTANLGQKCAIMLVLTKDKTLIAKEVEFFTKLILDDKQPLPVRSICAELVKSDDGSFIQNFIKTNPKLPDAVKLSLYANWMDKACLYSILNNPNDANATPEFKAVYAEMKKLYAAVALKDLTPIAMLNLARMDQSRLEEVLPYLLKMVLDESCKYVRNCDRLDGRTTEFIQDRPDDVIAILKKGKIDKKYLDDEKVKKFMKVGYFDTMNNEKGDGFLPEGTKNPKMK